MFYTKIYLFMEQINLRGFIQITHDMISREAFRYLFV